MLANPPDSEIPVNNPIVANECDDSTGTGDRGSVRSGPHTRRDPHDSQKDTPEDTHLLADSGRADNTHQKVGFLFRYYNNFHIYS